MKKHNENEIIEFEDVFKEEIKQVNEKNKPEPKTRYGFAVLAYILVMFLISSFIFLGVRGIDQYSVTYSKDEVVLMNLSQDAYGLVLYEDIDYQLLIQEGVINPYELGIETIYIYDGYRVIVNMNNTYARDRLSTDGILDVTKLESIYDNIIEPLEWTTDVPINLYQSDDQTLPSFVTTTEINWIEASYRTVTDEVSSAIQFVVYLILVISLVVILKKVIVADFKSFWHIKNQWITILALGYLYVILGNYASGFLTDILNSIFGRTSAISVNQASIEAMLHSNAAIYIIFSAGLLGPIVEELVFRKSIFGMIKDPRVAIVVSSVLFGLIHVTAEATFIDAIIASVSYITMGFVFGYIYIKNDQNIWAPILIHMLSNIISIAAVMFLF